jgi:hypothetical protein
VRHEGRDVVVGQRADGAAAEQGTRLLERELQVVHTQLEEALFRSQRRLPERRIVARGDDEMQRRWCELDQRAHEAAHGFARRAMEIVEDQHRFALLLGQPVDDRR